MNRPVSIRLRLTIWYVLVLFAGLSLFAVGIFVSLRSALYNSVDVTLRQHVEGMHEELRTELAEGLRGPHLSSELREWVRAVPEGYRIEVSDQAGHHLVPAEDRPNPRHSTSLVKMLEAPDRTFKVSGMASLDEADATLRRLGWMMAALVPVALLLAGAGGFWLSRRALEPVDQVTSAARAITLDNLSQRLAVPHTGDEIQRLSEAWNETLARLDSAVNRLRQFTSDAAHELRSPLAIIRTSAELALRKPRSPEDYQAALRNIVEEAERTARLVEDMLTLARADAGYTEFPVAAVDLSVLAQEAHTYAEALANRNGLRIETEVPEKAVIVQGNAAGLRRLLAVLVENAVKYTTPPGDIRLRVVAAAEGPCIEIHDTGPGIEARHLPHIFERFYRVDDSRNRDRGGTGLGLSIAKWIADRHHAEILVQSETGAGSTFCVRFPDPAKML